MKGTFRQYVTLGVMLLLLILIVSMFPEQSRPKLSGKLETGITVSKLIVPGQLKSVRTN